MCVLSKQEQDERDHCQEDFVVFTGQTQLSGTDLESTQVLIGELLERSFSLGSDSEAVGAVLKRPSLPSKCIVVA